MKNRRSTLSRANVSKQQKRDLKNILSSAPFLTPYLFFFALFGVIPLLLSIGISFFDWDFYTEAEFVGFKNYQLLFDFQSLTGGRFWSAVKNTLLFVVIQAPILIVLPLLIALLLHNCKKLKGLFRGIIYFPAVLSISTVCIIWFFIFDTNTGILNQLLEKNIPWITKLPFAWISIFILSSWWGIGGNMVLYLAGLTGVPRELTEAARLDGANEIQVFYNVTLPSMRNTLVYVAIMTVLSTFNVFGQPYMLTAGGPNRGTTVAIMEINNTAFGAYDFGMATAMSIILGIIMMVATVPSYILQKRGMEE